MHDECAILRRGKTVGWEIRDDLWIYWSDPGPDGAARRNHSRDSGHYMTAAGTHASGSTANRRLMQRQRLRGTTELQQRTNKEGTFQENNIARGPTNSNG